MIVWREKYASPDRLVGALHTLTKILRQLCVEGQTVTIKKTSDARGLIYEIRVRS